MIYIKVERLIGILTILLQKEKVTAPYLAERFEVSRRTISRDLEALCMAGIPVVTLQGFDGGIELAPGYTIDKNVLTIEELKGLLAGLKGIESITQDSRIQTVRDKLGISDGAFCDRDENIWIDLASHYKESLAEKIAVLQKAMDEHVCVEFTYYNKDGKRRRCIEPYLVVFKWSSWYVFGYCRERCDFRLFKLNRLWALELSADIYELRDIPNERLLFDNYYKDEYHLCALFDKSAEYRLIDEYGPESYTLQEDGRLKVTLDFTDYNYMTSWIMGFGTQAEVLEPESLRQEIGQQAYCLVEKYHNKT